METITTIGLDIAKSVFQVHGINAAGEVIARRRLSRGRLLAFFEKLPRCLVGIEACNTSHYWARELMALPHHRPNTWPHQPADATAQKSTCQRGAVHTRPVERPSASRRSAAPPGLVSAAADGAVEACVEIGQVARRERPDLGGEVFRSMHTDQPIDCSRFGRKRSA